MKLTCTIIGLALMGAVAAVAAPLQSSPRPLLKPTAVVPVVDVVSAAAPLQSVQPKPKPGQTLIAPAAALTTAPTTAPTRGTQVLTSLLPQTRPDALADLIQVSAPAPLAKTPQDASGAIKGAVCGDPSIRGQQITPIAATMKGCGLVDGVKVTAIEGVTLSTPVSVDCETADALKVWVKGTVLPSIGRKGGGLAMIEVADSYACRPRNNQRGNRLSEHGKGHAIDITGFRLQNGTDISVLDDWGGFRYGSVLKAIRKAACGTFTTVLGPGSDRFHRNHFHLDTARGRNAYCK